MVIAISQDDEIQLLAEQEHPGDAACGQGHFGQALHRQKTKWQLLLTNAKSLSLYYVVQHGEGWHDEADMVSVVSSWQEGATPLWKDISPSELQTGAESACNGLEEKISWI